MFKLWKDENKNAELRRIIAQERERRRAGWKHCTTKEKISDVQQWHNCSQRMATTAVYILCGDCQRQIDICNTFGEEYAAYNPKR